MCQACITARHNGEQNKQVPSETYLILERHSNQNNQTNTKLQAVKSYKDLVVVFLRTLRRAQIRIVRGKK